MADQCLQRILGAFHLVPERAAGLGQVDMVDRMGPDLDAVAVHLPDLLRRDAHAGVAHEPADDVGHGLEVVLPEDREGLGVEIGVAVVEGQDDGPVGQRPGAVQVGAEVIQGDRVEAVVLQVVHLGAEVVGRGREAPAQLVVDGVGRPPDVVVHEDRDRDRRASGRHDCVGGARR